jgi:hypothetical protein
MAERGYDQIRGGLYDAVEREPRNNLPIEFTWGDTKYFWQQEQAILAYLILLSVTGDNEPIASEREVAAEQHSDLRADFLALSREMQAFWNLYFLDHDNCGVYFRVTGNGVPFIQGNYGNKAGHSTGYHAEELNYLVPLTANKDWISYAASVKGFASSIWHFAMTLATDFEVQWNG